MRNGDVYKGEFREGLKHGIFETKLKENNHVMKRHEYKHDWLVNGEGSIKLNCGTIFFGTIKNGIPQVTPPFKFVYKNNLGCYSQESEEEEVVCTLQSRKAELKDGKYQNDFKDSIGRYQFVTPSGDLYKGKNIPDKQGKAHGKYELWYANGDLYYGDIREDLR